MLLKLILVKMKKRLVNKMEEMKEKAYFNLGSNEYYEGYHIDKVRWNGFARPYFEKYIADLFVNNFSTRDYQIVYNKYTDCYICKTIESGKVIQSDIAEKISINTKDGIKEVYDFGSIGWTWDSYTLEELKKEDNDRVNIISVNNFKDKEDSLNLEY